MRIADGKEREDVMSKPRYKWWGYVKAIVRSYPYMREREMNDAERKECAAVEEAIKQTMDRPSGREQLKLVELVFFKQTHTLEGAAMAIPCSYVTAKRWQQQFIVRVARNRGLMQ